MKQHWVDKLRGGRADKSNPEQFNQIELRKGIKHELSEHTQEKHIATEIVMDHLKEHPSYYSKLESFEKSLNKKAGGNQVYNNSRLSNYLLAATKYAGEDESSKKDKKEDKAEGGGEDKQQEQQAPPQAAPQQAPMPMAPMAPAMPTSPIDVMGQGLQQATTGLNQIIDSFYALQGGGPQQAPMPAGAPQASAVPGAPQPQPQQAPPGQPAGMQVQSAQTPSANPQKSAYADLMGGRYGGDGQGSGSTYYNFLRARVQQSQAITGGGQGMQASQNPPSSMI